MRRTMRSGFLALALLAGGGMSAEAADIQGKAVTLPSSERQVRVVQFKAAGDGVRPAALLLHGAGGFDRRLDEYNRYAATLANAGIDAYLVYYYSEADEKSMSTGFDVFTRRYPAWAKMVGDLAHHLQAQKDSNGKVGLVGFSNGGILATGAASLDAKIGAAVIYYGTEPWPLSTPAKRFPPLLVLHGDADRIIPVQAGRQLADKAKQLGAPVDLVIYPGESHGFGADFAKKNATDALDRTIAFLKKELQAK